MAEPIPCVQGRVHRWTEVGGFGWFAASSVWDCDCGLLRIYHHTDSAPFGCRIIYARIEAEGR